MADLYPNINFPKIDFSPLGDLPQTIEEASGRRAVKEGLAGLKSTDPDQMEAAAQRILSSPGVSTTAIEKALTLQKAALDRRELNRKIAADVAYGQAVGPLQQFIQSTYGGGGAKAAAPPEGKGAMFDFIPTPPETPAAPTAVPGPQSQLLPPAPGEPRGPATAALGGGTMSDASPIGVPPPTQLAQAAPPPVAQPTAVPQAPRGGRSLSTPPEVEQQLLDLGMRAAAMGKVSPTQKALVMEQLRVLLRKTEWSPDEKQWQAERTSDYLSGDPNWNRSFSDFMREKQTAPALGEETIKTYDKYQEGHGLRKAGEVVSQLQALKQIANDPRFISGVGAEGLRYAGSAVQTAIEAAKAMGVPQAAIDAIGTQFGAGRDFHNITDPAKLQDVFHAISNQLIYARIGSLGTGISNSDRTFVQDATPALTTTKEGNKILIDIMMAEARQKEELSRALAKYREDRGARAKGYELDKFVHDFKEGRSIFVNKDGQPTELGRRLTALKAAKEEPVPTVTGTIARGIVEGAKQGINAPPLPAGEPGQGPGARPPMPEGPSVGTLPGERAAAPAGTAIPPSLNMQPPQPEGQILYDSQGRRSGIIQGGRPRYFNRPQEPEE